MQNQERTRVMFIDFEEYSILRTATRLKNREDQCIESLSSIIAVIEKAATNLVGQLLEGMLVTYRSAKAKSIDTNDSFTEATNKQLGVLKSVEKLEKIQRNVSMMFSLADKNASGYICKRTVKSTGRYSFQHAVKMCPRSIHSLLKSDAIQELMEQIQKEFEDRVSIKNF